MSKIKNPTRFVVCCFGIFVIATVVPYIIVFHSGLSGENQDWASFGGYLSGVCSLANVAVFIVISLMIHNIDVKNRDREIEINQRKEIFSRFLVVYEDLVGKSYRLRSHLARVKTEPEAIRLDNLLEIYSTIKVLDNYGKIYLPNVPLDNDRTNAQDELSPILANFLDEHVFALISILERKNSSDELERQAAATAQKIDLFIDNLNSFTSKYIENRI